MRRIDLSDQVIGYLTVIRIEDCTDQGMRWRCRCACGKIRIVRASRLKNRRTISCGECSKIKHGHSKNISKEYIAWKAMKQRCRDSNTNAYHRYGGRGIRVCKEWRYDFLKFFHYIGPAPSTDHSIDRYPNRNGNYCPGNVRWATSEQQARNRNRRGLR